MRVSIWPVAAAVVTAAWLLPVPAANAQTQAPAPGLSDRSAQISDQKLDAAAAAIASVTSVKQSYQQQMADAAPSDKQRIANEANGALVKAVTDQGLSVEEYNSIVTVAQDNPEVHAKLLERLRR